MNRRSFLLSIAATLSAGPAVAHSMDAKHGGIVTEAGDFHVELVVKDDVIDVHVRDHDDKAMSVAGFKAVALFTLGGKPQRVSLEVVEDKRLSGKAPTALPKKLRMAIQITPPGKRAFTARFD